MLRPVKTSKRMFPESTFGEIAPHAYSAVMALSWFGDRHPASYNIYRRLALFHSFVSDDPETFEYAVEIGVKTTYLDSELDLTVPLSEAASTNRYQSIVDFDKFPVPVPTSATNNESYLQGYREEANGPEIPGNNKCEEINYRNAFQLFVEWENSKNNVEEKLYDGICSYVFVRSLWNLSNISLLYRNDALSVAFYIAILESIIGEPAMCDGEVKCSKCGKLPFRHHGPTWRKHFIEKLNEFESGWGDKYADTIVALRNEMRHKFTHTARYDDVPQQLWNIYDHRYYRGKTPTENDIKEERRLFDRDKNVSILERTIRKGLFTRFLNYCLTK